MMVKMHKKTPEEALQRLAQGLLDWHFYDKVREKADVFPRLTFPAEADARRHAKSSTRLLNLWDKVPEAQRESIIRLWNPRVVATAEEYELMLHKVVESVQLCRELLRKQQDIDPIEFYNPDSAYNLVVLGNDVVQVITLLPHTYHTI
jgi:hypothetical protein